MDTSDVESVESSPIVGKIKRRKKILPSSSSSSSSGDDFQVQKDFVLPTKRRRNKYSGIGVAYDDSCVQASSERKVEDTTDQSYLKCKEEQASSERKVEDTTDQSYLKCKEEQASSERKVEDTADESYIKRKEQHDERYRKYKEPFKKFKLLTQELIASCDNDTDVSDSELPGK